MRLLLLKLNASDVLNINFYVSIVVYIILCLRIIYRNTQQCYVVRKSFKKYKLKNIKQLKHIFLQY